MPESSADASQVAVSTAAARLTPHEYACAALTHEDGTAVSHNAWRGCSPSAVLRHADVERVGGGPRCDELVLTQPDV